MITALNYTQAFDVLKFALYQARSLEEVRARIENEFDTSDEIFKDEFDNTQFQAALAMEDELREDLGPYGNGD